MAQLGDEHVQAALVEEGLADVEAGRTFPHGEVMKRYEQWL